MGLNALLNPKSFVQDFASGRTLGNTLYNGDFDKNNESLYGNITSISTTVINWADEIAKIAGTRNPMYMIGDVSESVLGEKGSQWIPDQVKGLVRAISQFTEEGVTQQGVIIDGIGDVGAEISVDMPKNPFMYRAEALTDQRVRNPNIVKMRIMVSNYLQDGLSDILLDSISGLDPTGLTRNVLSDSGNTRAQQALYKLRWIQEKGIPFTLHTPHGIYENMLIKAIRPRTDERNMDMLDAEIEFNEVIMYASLGSYQNKLARNNIKETSSEYKNATNWDWLQDKFK